MRGREIETLVQDKNLVHGGESDSEEEDFECEKCDRVIPPANFRIGHRNEG